MTSGNLKILQCNCQRAYGVLCDLGNVMNEQCVSVALLQELYVSHGCVKGLPSAWRVYVCESNPAKAAVVIRDVNVEAVCVSECTDEYGVCVWIKGDFGELYVVSMYCRYGHDIAPYLTYMERVKECVRGKRVLFGMDANATSPLWYSKGGGRSRENEMRGRTLEEWVLANGMIVLNEPSEYYTFSGARGQSDIDVTLVSELSVRCRFEWEVKGDWGISDHNVILIRMTCDERQRSASSVCKRWVCKDVDWEGYKSDLMEYELIYGQDVWNETNVDRMLERMMQWIQGANDKRMKVKKRVNDRKIVWWTDDLRKLKAKVRRSRKLWQRARKRKSKDVDARLSRYKSLMSEYKREMWRVKEENWRQFVSVSSNLDPWGPVYRVCRGKTGRERMSSLKVDGVNYSTWRECAEVLLERFFPAASMSVGASGVGEWTNEIQEFGWDEVNEAVMAAKLGKAPGLDGITVEMLRMIWYAIPGCLLRLYNECLKSGYFPDEWKKACVVVLLKSPEKPRSDPASYRPISLLSVLGKTLERMMMKRHERRVSGSMDDAQHGFRRGRSTESAWLRMRGYVEESECKYVLGVFVDFKGAFDNLEWSSVIEWLNETGCEEIPLWKSYFQRRVVCMYSANDVVWKDVERGCPQGSTSGPFLWIGRMNKLLRRLRECGCKCVAFADDLTLIVEGQNRMEVERKGAEWMAIVCEWGAEVGVSVSEGKTVTMLLKGSMAASRRPIVRMNGKPIKYVVSVKYLGIWMSERMHFKVHLEYLRTKVMNAVGAMRRVLKSEWGMRKRAVRLVYKGLFVACVMYGASVWYEVMQYEYARDLMNRCQRVVLYACLNVCRTVSTESMQVLMGTLPWDLECARRGVCSMLKSGGSVGVNEIVASNDLDGRAVDDCVMIVNERAYDCWQRRWDESENGRVTYEYIKNVRFAESCVQFEPNVYACFLLTGHGSMNAFLYKRGLSASERCICGAEREDWKHVLVECSMYDDLRDLNECGVVRREDGSVDVSGVLVCKEKYERFCVYAREVFERRRRMCMHD